ncbi:glutaredoxin 3 [Actibacterium pelagium]|uniref:Glutaredoxin n=1 Tax=Actibacterium pelagium TaxID=2029103 RepID=A0A917ELZ8_9RHOB|nr:glutaredoxin 3 [Actibacterium pelagium]GGE55221.1 glutaredoxin 3 [Actibacterium pelagium]
MKTVEIYTKSTCGFCHMAKRLLTSKGVKFSEVDILVDPDQRPTMIQRANGRSTVPQVFIDGQHIGGFDDLSALDRAGKLDPILAA